MQKMILIPVEQYNRMIESYDKAMEELQEVREQLTQWGESGQALNSLQLINDLKFLLFKREMMEIGREGWINGKS
jgi:hypothetical protein